MVVKNGDEYHGKIRKNHQQKQLQSKCVCFWISFFVMIILERDMYDYSPGPILFGHPRSRFPLQNQAHLVQWRYLEAPGSFDQWFVNGFIPPT